jgi:hypothetical protein
MKKIYDKEFYENRNQDTYVSAQKILKLIFEKSHPKSVIDFGCGVGTWLKVSKNLGATNVLGFEGSWLNKSHLEIDENEFQYANLSEAVILDEKYDLAISLEVAEHIDENFADTFVSNLVNASDVVLFSAAIPFQRGSGHVNEQWPEYWIEKFASHNYTVIDFVRPKIWNENGIKTWYKQNVLLYINKEKISLLEAFNFSTSNQSDMYSIVHPRTFIRQVELSQPKYMPLFKTLKALPYLFFNRFFKKILK